MSSKACLHPDVREFDSLRSCLACGDTWFPTQGGISDEAEQYIYTDLRCLERGQTIRIVVVEPGEYLEPLRCTLKLSDLRYTTYHAVSYTWATEDGDDAKTQQILIDGRVLSVTKNCEAALRRLRQYDPHSRFWIDAICINQSSTAERNHQVNIMGRIYRNAMRVHVCVEDGRHNYTEVMRSLAFNTSSRHISSYMHHDGLSTLSRCRYFSRVWVIQEVALAKVITLHVNNDCLDLSHQALSSMGRGLPRLLENLTEPATQQSLTQLLKLTFAANCSEPKDRIYAIHSLLDAPAKKWIPIDYSLSVEEISANAVLACINTTRSLNILIFARTDCERLETEVKSFSVDSSHWYLMTYPWDPRWSASKPKTWRPHVYLDCSDRADTLADTEVMDQSISPVQVSLDPIPRGQILPRLKVRAYYIDDVRGRSDLSFGHDLENLRTMDFNTDDLTEDLRSYLALWKLSCKIPQESNMEDIASFVGRASKKLKIYDYRVFGTTHGIGVCGATVRPRDQMFFLDGVAQPFVLRPLEMTCSDLQQSTSRYCRTFRIVGSCRWESLPPPETSSDTESPRARHKPSEQYEVIEIY